MSTANQIRIPPTGRITLQLDWASDLNVPPRCGATLTAASWTLPTGITEIAESIDGTKAEITIATANLKLGSTPTLVCSATLSNSDVLTAAVVCLVAHREVKRSTEACPTP